MINHMETFIFARNSAGLEVKLPKLTTKKTITCNLFVIECPTCGHYAAQAKEWSLLPAFATCSNCLDISSIIKF